jgi:hypothetical protein
MRTDTEVVFSWINPDLVYYTHGNGVRWMNLATGESELIVMFPQFTKLSAYGAEGDLTHSGLLVLYGLDGNGVGTIFTLNVLNGHASNFNQQRDAFDGRKITETGYQLVSKSTGIYATPPEGISYPITEANGHACPSTYQGRDVLLWCTNGRRRDWINALEMVDVVDPNRTRVLFDLGKKNYAMQLSQGPGDSCIMCLYDDSTVLPFQIWKVPLDNSSPTMLHEYTAAYRDYDSSPKASYSEGRVLFSDDDGQIVNVRRLDLQEALPALPYLSGNGIPYGSYAGKSEFVIRPQHPCPTCGSSIKGIFEEPANG